MKKRIIIAAFATFLSQSYAHAQQISPQTRTVKQTEWMKDHLELTSEQVPKVEEINMRYGNKIQEIYNGQQTQAEKKEALVMLHNKKDVELRQIFTENQYSAYKIKEN